MTPQIGGILKTRIEKESAKMGNKKSYDRSFKERFVTEEEASAEQLDKRRLRGTKK